MSQAFAFTIRIYYEDTDAGGIVYYANYLKYLERARTEWLRAAGFEQDALARHDGVMFVVRSIAMEFLKPAYFNDLIEVSAAIAGHGGASITFAQAIRRVPAGGVGTANEAPPGTAAAPSAVRHSVNEPDELLCEAELRVACLDAATRVPRALPPALARRLREVAA